MRGTTPTHMFHLPFDTALIERVRIIYAHDTTPVLVKETESCTLDGNTVCVRLTQEETLLFEDRKNLNIQIRILKKDGDALRSKIYTRNTGVLLDDEVLT